MNLDLDYLLSKLRSNPEEILAAIDEDPQLVKRENSVGLVISNATKGLMTPNKEHQLFAKGIVFTRNPYKLVSLPLIKMYNHEEDGKEFVDETTMKLLALGVPTIMPFKEDGFLAQAFEYEGQVYYTTRSILDGVQYGGDFEPLYIDMIKELAAGTCLEDPGTLRGLTVVCEAIHPRSEESGVTKYGDRKDLVVISIFDHSEHIYWSTERVNTWAKGKGLTHPEILAYDWKDFEKTLEDLSLREDIPEGGVVCFEKEGRIIHRVKMKTQAWFHVTMLTWQCNIRTVSNHLWSNPELHDWDTYLKFLWDNELLVEEIIDRYRAFFDEYHTWINRVDTKVEEVTKLVQEVSKEINSPKEMATYAKRNHPEDFGLWMACYNGKDAYTIALRDRRIEPFRGARDYLVAKEKGLI